MSRAAYHDRGVGAAGTERCRVVYIVRRGTGQRTEGRTLDEAEEALVERARTGDVAAYEALVRRYQVLAFRTAYLVLGTAADAEDAAQDAFVKAYYALVQHQATYSGMGRWSWEAQSRA